MSDLRRAAPHLSLIRLVSVGLVLLMLSVLPSHAASGQISPGKLARAHKTLEGASQCVQCHALSRAPMAGSCLNCHKDVKLLIDQKRGYHARLSAAQRTQCASCHPDHAGEAFDLIAWPGGGKSRFDHRQAGWALQGKHADAKCESCHTKKFATAPSATLSKRTTGTPWIGLEGTCLSCHKADDVHDGELKGGCDQCHDAKAWSPAPTFDHEDARYPLTGKHVDVKCDGCHKSTRLTLKVSAKGERLAKYRPLAYARCNDCHADPHQGRLKGACSTCHETKSWDAIDRRDFNHGATRYPLAGKHNQVGCAACHGKNNETPTPAFSTCASCHADVHRGEAGRGRDCASCHKVAGFSPATFTVADHATTAYPLKGKHVSASCRSCHSTTTLPSVGAAAARTARATPTRYVRLTMASGTCQSCHEDSHAGQKAVKVSAGGCLSCHTEDGFAPSTITATAHAQYRFALDGAHANTTCAACHSSTRTGFQPLTADFGKAKFAFAIGDTTCAGCHVDPHAGRYLPGGARATTTCRACHAVSRFRPSSVTSEAHTQFGYLLEGAHRAVTCAECHAELKAPAGKGTLKLTALRVPALPLAQARGAACASCHQDVHDRQFSARKDKGACESCHTVARFSGAERFNHEKSRFKLAGAHAKVACAQCHLIPPGRAPTTPESARRQYAGVSVACESCHSAGPVRGR